MLVMDSFFITFIIVITRVVMREAHSRCYLDSRGA